MNINERIEAVMKNEAITQIIKRYSPKLECQEKPMTESEKAVYREAMEINEKDFAEVVIQDALLGMD